MAHIFFQQNKIDKDQLSLIKDLNWESLNIHSKKLGDNFTPSILKRKERELMLFNGYFFLFYELIFTFELKVNGLDEDVRRFNSNHEEIEFFANHYKIPKIHEDTEDSTKMSKIYEENALLAEANLEMNVANIWRNTYFILEDSKK